MGGGECTLAAAEDGCLALSPPFSAQDKELVGDGHPIFPLPLPPYKLQGLLQ